MESVCFAPLLLALLLSISDTFAIHPVMTAVQTDVVVKEGSNVNLTCHGRNVRSYDTTVLWKFNGQKIQENTNKEVIQRDFRRGYFSLHIKNVSIKDVGNYTCLAMVSAGSGKTNNDEDYVKLSLDKKDTIAIHPVMKAVHTDVVVKEGSNVTLTCLGHNVERPETRVIWKFNGHKIKGDSNKKKFLDKKRGHFSLYIKNVSIKDVGNYTCLAKVSGLKSKMDDNEDYVKLSLDEKDNKSDVETSGSTTGTPTSDHQTGKRKRSQPKKDLHSSFHTTPARSQMPSLASNTKIDGNPLRTMLFIILGLPSGLMTMAVLIKLWKRRRRKPPVSLRHPPDMDGNDFKYDVFVTYSRKDSLWVKGELLSLLRENQVKYFVDHEHFELGKVFVKSMVDSVYQSRKVLAVWSEGYASSRYCMPELDYAVQRSFQNSDCSVIVIRLDKTDQKQLPKPLQARTFLHYSDSVERQGWEKRLIKHLKGSDQKNNIITTIV